MTPPDAATARACLAQIRPAALDYDEWLAALMASKDAGLSFEEVDRWSAQDTKRYKAREMIDRIAGAMWRVPVGVRPAEYRPEPVREEVAAW